MYAHQDNTVTKVFHHQAPADELELGKVVLYVAQDPKELKASIKHTDVNDTFNITLPNTHMSDAAQGMLKTLAKSSHYNVRLEQDKKGKDIILSIDYDPKKIVCEYENFIAIDMQKGLVVRLYNKPLLDRLNAKGHRVMMRTACSTHKPKIVIDCGHGGGDFGAVSANGIKEKDVVKDIGVQLAQALQQQGWDVVYTRDPHKDVFVALDERTKIANFNGADFFLSIHANNSSKVGAQGIETFSITPGLFKSGSQLADETLTQARAQRNDLFNTSTQWAHHIHAAMYDTVKKKYVDVIDRGLKHQVAQVLLGITKPGVLVEIGFINDPLITQKGYQKSIVRGLCNGIQPVYAQLTA